ncbi:MAG: tetratricopeptide repeat protein [Dactylosporangium sp.]|nr:tetratricopeptide repeat protein [Dactylosporangium sp.]
MSAASFSVTPRQLPGTLSGFVNRTTELATLLEIAAGAEAAPPAGIIVITGTAGVGKTSLALRLAHRLRDRFPGGELYVNLRGYDPGEPATAHDVLGRFLRDLGVPAGIVGPTAEERAALYRSVLAERRTLIVLDNAATVAQVRPLLPGAAGCLVVVTSRDRMAGLVAREGALRVRLALLAEDDAVALLRAVTADLRPGDRPAELAELAALCARLPLALRIAAERAASRPQMGLAELIADLRDESELWDALTVDGDADADAVRTVFAWSYRALPEPAAILFRRLGLHPGGEFDLPAAAALAGATVPATRHALDALVGAHLVEHSAPGRYRVHDLLRAYAVDQANALETTDARAEVRQRVLTWYLHTAHAAAQLVSPLDHYPLDDPTPAPARPLAFADAPDAVRWYQVESTNLVASTRAAADHGFDRIAWQLAAVLRGLCLHQNAFDDWITTATIGLQAAARCGDRAGQAEATESLGKAYFQAMRLPEAETCHRQALAIRRDLGDRFGEAVCRNALGLLGLRRRTLADAQARFEQAAAIFADLSEPDWAALMRGNLAETLCERGQYPQALAILDELLAVFDRSGDRAYQGNTLFLLAWAHRGAGHLDDADAALGRALEIAEDDDNDVWRAHWLTERTRLRLAQARPADALVDCQRAAVLQRRLGDRNREATALDLTGLAYRGLDRPDEAVPFHRRAASVHQDFRDWWQLARALAHLADALDQTGEAGAAEQHRREAVGLLDSFDDAIAVGLRRQLMSRLPEW